MSDKTLVGVALFLLAATAAYFIVKRYNAPTPTAYGWNAGDV